MEIKPMNVRNGLKAVCVIARHIDDLAPYLVAFSNTKNPKVRRGLLVKVFEVIKDNVAFQEDLVAFMAHALDISYQEAGELDFHFVIESLPEILKVNDFEKFMEAAIMFNIVEPKKGVKLWFLRK